MRPWWDRIASSGRFEGSQELSELIVGQLGVTVSVNPPHDRNELSFIGTIALAPQEAPQSVCVHSSLIVPVQGLEGSEWSVIVPVLEISLQPIQSPHQIDFLLYDLKKAEFHVVGQVLETANLA